MLGQADLVPPFHARNPTALAQIGGGRAERVGDRIDEILAAVAIEVDATLRNVDGMNWVWPKAPAQDPLNWAGSMSPCWMILSAAMNSERK